MTTNATQMWAARLKKANGSVIVESHDYKRMSRSFVRIGWKETQDDWS